MKHFTIILHVQLEDDTAVNTLLHTLVPFTVGGSMVVQDECAVQVDSLTKRERRLLVALTTCDTIADAARELCISIGTARKCLESIYRKFGVHSLHRAIAVAVQGGLLKSIYHTAKEETEC